MEKESLFAGYDNLIKPKDTEEFDGYYLPERRELTEEEKAKLKELYDQNNKLAMKSNGLI